MTELFNIAGESIALFIERCGYPGDKYIPPTGNILVKYEGDVYKVDGVGDIDKVIPTIYSKVIHIQNHSTEAVFRYSVQEVRDMVIRLNKEYKEKK